MMGTNVINDFIFSNLFYKKNTIKKNTIKDNRLQTTDYSLCLWFNVLDNKKSQHYC